MSILPVWLVATEIMVHATMLTCFTDTGDPKSNVIMMEQLRAVPVLLLHALDAS